MLKNKGWSGPIQHNNYLFMELPRNNAIIYFKQQIYKPYLTKINSTKLERRPPLIQDESAPKWWDDDFQEDVTGTWWKWKPEYTLNQIVGNIEGYYRALGLLSETKLLIPDNITKEQCKMKSMGEFANKLTQQIDKELAAKEAKEEAEEEAEDKKFSVKRALLHGLAFQSKMQSPHPALARGFQSHDGIGHYLRGTHPGYPEDSADDRPIIPKTDASETSDKQPRPNYYGEETEFNMDDFMNEHGNDDTIDYNYDGPYYHGGSRRRARSKIRKRNRTFRKKRNRLFSRKNKRFGKQTRHR